jgi:hypothetical protein
VVNGTPRPNRPPIAFNANRVQSLSGNYMSDPLWEETGRSTMLTAGSMNGSVTAAADSAVPLAAPDFPGGGLSKIVAVGDFYGDGAASILGENAESGAVAIWRDPIVSVNSRYEVAFALPSSDWSVSGVGDFNGDGYTDVLTWNAGAQSAKVFFLNGSKVAGTLSSQPTTASDWRLMGVGDFDQNGCSDLLLRDSNGNLEILYFALGEGTESTDFDASSLGYTADTSGTFDKSWNVVGVGDVVGDGYASIVWQNPATAELGYTYFTLSRPQQEWGTLIAPLTAGFQVEEVADFNGDGTGDLWLWDQATHESLVWFLNSSSSGPRGPYASSPPLDSPGLGWQLVAAP